MICIFLPIFIVCETISIKFNDNNGVTFIEENVIENQVCSGYFHNIESHGCLFTVTIDAKKGNSQYFKMEDISFNQKVSFSFSIVKAQVIVVKITRKPITADIFGPAELTYNFTKDDDTFKDSVKKEARIVPAMAALVGLQVKINKVIVKLEKRIVKMRKLRGEHSRLMGYITILSVMAMVIVIVINIHQTYALKKFFKSKKLI